MYIGKKLTKHRVNKKIRESDWRTYYGSSEQLLTDLKEMGDEVFNREILYLCKGKSVCSYVEMREQILRDVLLRDDYYNQFIGGKIHARNIKILKGNADENHKF